MGDLLRVFLFWCLILSTAHACIEWISVGDGRHRKHCYTFQRSPTAVNAFEADDYCRTLGARLAPFIDDYQYAHLLSLRPPDAGETFIGTNDIAVEDTWVNFDGSAIAGNRFILTMTGYPTLQPNGDTSQNCAVINAFSGSTTYVPEKTQDKSCSTDYRTDMLCYTEDYTGSCLNWTSTADSKKRNHCYWLTSKTPGATSWTVSDAMQKCQCEGGSLAPVIDDIQSTFLLNLLTTIISSTATDTGAWLATHNIKGTPANWNGDPSISTISAGAPVGEYCQLVSVGGTRTWRPCSYDDVTVVYGALCYKEDVTVSLSIPKTASAPKNTTILTAEEIRKELIINPKETNAFRISKISVYEDRPTAKSIGFLGIALLAGFFAFIVILDCQRLEQCCRKG
uniref:Uncharacterized protein LOC111138089 n=1 Tax=Crassostrea virginica TaxID=6565 RepID=A0A8B8F1C6_CRAVI|nr:uncharacterized protein LOC111138089 [Crassostrea virginica]